MNKKFHISDKTGKKSYCKIKVPKSALISFLGAQNLILGNISSTIWTDKDIIRSTIWTDKDICKNCIKASGL